MQPTGGVFFREAEGIDAKKLVAKVYDGGRITTASGIAFAVHPPKRGFWAIIDDRDGALGVGGGDWSSVAIAANHLRTDAVWYRTYAIDLALAIYFPNGGTWMRAYAGITDDVINRLDADGVPVHDAQPPATADQALVARVEFEDGKYTSGPDETVARQLFAIHEALVAGEPDALRAQFLDLAEEHLALGIAIIGGADRGAWRACLEACAAQLLAEPPRLRSKLGKLTLDEEVLRRAGELVTGDDFTRVLDHLDAIEADAGARSAHSHPAGVSMLAYQLSTRGDHEGALQCELRLLRRKDPAWYTCNHVLNTLLRRSPFTLDEPAREALRIVEARLADLGQSAVDAITYNLACVYARAGDPDRALVELRRCETPLEQNPHPEADTDLEPLWNHPEFKTLIAPPPKLIEIPAEPEPDYDVPAEFAVPRFAIDLHEGGDPTALIDRLGGKPNAPTADVAWPASSSRPMDFVGQIVGTAGGGKVDLGDIHVLQIFADLEGEFFEQGEHAVIAHRAPCVAVVEPPPTVTVADVRAMVLEPGFDDRRLLDDDFESDEARHHGWCDKIGGVPMGGNLDRDLRDEDDEPMRFILELMTYDDWFLWALFAKQDLSTYRLEIVRG